jgi:hypothetical protein
MENNVLTSLIFLLLFSACETSKTAITSITSKEIEVLRETKNGCIDAYILGNNTRCEGTKFSIVKDTCTINPLNSSPGKVYLKKAYTPKLATIEIIESYLFSEGYCNKFYRTYRGYETTSNGKLIHVVLVTKHYVRKNPKLWYYISPTVSEPYRPNQRKRSKGKSFYFDGEGRIINNEIVGIKIAKSTI